MASAAGHLLQADRWTGSRDAPRTGPVPVLVDRPGGASRESDVVAAWWWQRPYEVQVAPLDALGQRPALAAMPAGSGSVGTGVRC